MGDEREEFQTRGEGLEEVIEQMVRPLQKIVMAGKDQMEENLDHVVHRPSQSKKLPEDLKSFCLHFCR